MKTKLCDSPTFLPPSPLLSLFNYANGRVPQPGERCTPPLFLRSPSWPMTAKTRPAHCCQLQCGPLPPREERRGEERRRAERLGHCSSAHRLHSERWSPVIGAFARVFPPSTRVFAFFFLFLFFFFSFSSFQALNRRHRRLCANVFRNRGRGRVTRVTHCQDTIHDSAVTLAFVRGWTEIRGGFFGFDRLKYETRFKVIPFLFFTFFG